jgi:large subunit ribosomal protein L4
VVFGPKPRDFSKGLSRKTKKLALRKALSERLKDGEVIVVDGLKIEDHKTKSMLGILKKLKLDGTVLIVSEEADRNMCLAARNLKKVEITTGDSLNTYEVLRSDRIVFTRAALQKLEQRLKD